MTEPIREAQTPHVIQIDDPDGNELLFPLED